MSDAERIARALNGKRTTEGFLCRCPVPGHGKGQGDRNPSLLVKNGERAPLVTCFSGCDHHDAMPCGAADFWIILAALGQLRPHARTAREHRKRRTPPILKRWRFGARPPSAPTRSSSLSATAEHHTSNCPVDSLPLKASSWQVRAADDG